LHEYLTDFVEQIGLLGQDVNHSFFSHDA
jgi:hypothetical protein